MKIKKRIKKTSPKAGKRHWCISCDMNLVRVGQKCVVCKHKEKTKHQKP